MKRFGLFMVLAMVTFGSSAQARSFSFAIAGHWITIEAPRHCRSARCLSVSIPGLHQKGGGPESDDDTAAVAAPAKPVAPPAAAPAPPQPAAPAQIQPAPAPVAVRPTPTVTALSRPAVDTTAVLPATPPQAPPLPAPAPSIEPAASAARPVPAAAVETVAAPLVAVSRHSPQQIADSPLGDWQTEAGTGTVRIEPCGAALCGYLLNPPGSAKGETVLVNMKPSGTALEWSGGVFSRASGNTYYGTMTLTRPNALRVEACALGHFFCSGNNWTRIEHNPDETMMSRRIMPPQRS